MLWPVLLPLARYSLVMGTHSLAPSPFWKWWKLELKFLTSLSEFAKGTRHPPTPAPHSVYLDRSVSPRPLASPAMGGNDSAKAVFASKTLLSSSLPRWSMKFSFSVETLGRFPSALDLYPGTDLGMHIANLGMFLFGGCGGFWENVHYAILSWVLGKSCIPAIHTYTSKRKTNKQNTNPNPNPNPNGILSKHSICWFSMILFL